ncbi:hypothetical protein C922_05691 [Plasmodium inui San Antonio 1]|uniref:Uncharacterized protein n=1 Tax=Plasmodium inui San Antonio 1 TaxID=1237626 RepID=W6ZX95_9APIC|nr:hypothetical protein C922_05691 [Plasmodium inui San Antonio 1]EUD63928.1 hypothetical protein C922_05691 [Plasmodium inui San Antonio 1]
MSPKKEITTISSKEPRKPKNTQPRNRLPKLSKNELSTMMCIQVTERGLRLKELEITFPFPIWLDPRKRKKVSEQPKDDRISPSKVSENNYQEQIETKKSNESFNSSDAKNLTSIDTEESLISLKRKGRIEFIMLHILLTSESINPLKSKLMTNVIKRMHLTTYMLFYFLRIVIDIITNN